LRSAHHHLDDRPISLSFVRELHKVLLNSVRGQDKSPGEFRKEQNWIGSPGSSIDQASFVPPNPFQLQGHLDAWQMYLEFNYIDLLLQSAVVHAQFELLHPFSDGNGRIGRILIPLFLYQKKKLSQPMFYLSSYLEAHRDEYYGHLQNISIHSDWNSWIAFFLQAISIQAHTNSQKVKAIMGLYEEMKIKIRDITHSQYGIQILDAIFDRPIFKTTDFIVKTGIRKPTALKYLRQLKNAGVLSTLLESSGSRPAVLYFPKLINIAEGKDH